MTLEEQIAFFEKAKKYYSWWNIFKKSNYYGVCVFMHARAGGLNTPPETNRLIRSLLDKYRTTPKWRPVFFHNHKERRKAINQVLKDLKSQL